ncbi:MAG: N-acetylmuramoyl-L-alanine amidase family protein [Thermacetogeniaceae bacterium]
MAGKTVVVDPGHGGSDPGCVGCSGVYEKNVNLEVAKRLAFYLTQAGATAILTRDGDYELSDGLEGRIWLVRQHKADIFVSIHANSISSARWWGAQTFYHPRDREGQRLAALIQDELLKGLGQSYRWILDEDFYVLRNAGVPAVMVEVGFLSNPREERMLSQAEYQGKVAWCIYAGIVRYFAGEPAPPCPF